MKKLITILSLLIIGSTAYSQPTPLRAGYQDSAWIHQSWGWTTPGMWVYLPWDYYSTTKNYPVIIFMNGAGENGTNLSTMLNNGLPQVIASGNPPYAYNGADTTRFIVISPQAPDAYHIDDQNKIAWSSLVTDASGYKLRVDSNRIYLTGLSQGGEASFSLASISQDGFKPAAVVSMSPSHAMNSTYYTASNYTNIPIWFIGGNNDLTVGTTAQDSYNWITAANGQRSYKLSVYSGGHSGWATFYGPTWQDNQALSNSPTTLNKTLYQWMTQYSLVNPPTVSAGTNQVLAAGTTSTTLTGTASTHNGTIKSYQWIQTSGSTVTIVSPTAATTSITGLANGGSYTFKLTVTDDSLQTASASVNVQVSGTASVSARSIYVNFSSDASHNGGGYWNDLNTTPSSTTVITGLRDSSGGASLVGLKSLNGNVGYDNSGKSTGNNSGIYPDNVIVSDWFVTPDGATYSFKVTGLKADSFYKFTFFASNVTANRATLFNIGTDSITLVSYNNTSNVVTIDSAKAAPDSTVTVNVSRGTGTSWGNFNAMVIRGSFTYKDMPLSANAGPDQFLDTGATSTTLYGTASVGNGKLITSYQWSQLSGDLVTITSPSSPTTTVTGLIKGGNYSFKLQVTDNASEIVYDTVNVKVNLADTTDYKLPLDSAGKYWAGDTLYYQFSSTNRYINAQELIGNQANDTTSVLSTGYFYGNDTTNRGIIDLGGYYAIKSAYLNAQAVTTTMMIQFGSPGNWSTAIPLNINGSGWFKFPWTGYQYTRYIRVWAKVGYGAGNLLLYGHLVKDSLSRIQPAFAYHKPSLPMSQAIGTNITWTPNQFYNLLGNYRYYTPDGSAIDTSVHIVDSLTYNFGSAGTGYLHFFFPDSSSAIQSSTTPANEPYNLVKTVEDSGKIFWYASNAWSSYFDNHGVNFPVDPVAHPDRDSSNPYNYDRISNQYWLQAAVYGTNTIPWSSLSIQVKRPDSSGYGTLRYLEPGNEYDEDWNGLGMDPHAWTAYMSAVYDGNGNTMGPRRGIKNASPTTQVIQPGTARAMATPKWLQYSQNLYTQAQRMRPKGAQVLPFDIANFHYYANNDTIGVAPEQDSVRMKVKRYYDMINQQSAGKMQIWCTEFGYDWNGLGKQTTPIAGIGTMNNKILQGVWMIRNILAMSGYVDLFTQYQLYDIDYAGGTYATSGLMSDNGDKDYNGLHWPNPSLYYMLTFRHVLQNYIFDTVTRGNAGDSVWCYRFKNVNNDSVAYVVWCPTSTDRHITNMSFQTGHANTQANIVSFAPIQEMMQDTMTYSEQYGVSSPQTSTSSGSINFNISEIPTFVLTTSGTGGTLTASTTTSPGTLNFYSVYYLSGKVIIMFKDPATGKLYNMTLKSQ
ncbi:MAG: hypothetical protein EPN37_07255 [Chitinophagaceae bacterium]|nr:MAG: hypothetical protein EPN37_07255 [Chitinophagaceae bacterium]